MRHSALSFCVIASQIPALEALVGDAGLLFDPTSARELSSS